MFPLNKTLSLLSAIFLIAAVVGLAYASAQVEITETPTSVPGVVIEAPPLPTFNNNTANVNFSQFAEIWLATGCTNGRCDVVADLFPNFITNGFNSTINIFNQDLNMSSNVSFANVTVSGQLEVTQNLTVGDFFSIGKTMEVNAINNFFNRSSDNRLVTSGAMSDYLTDFRNNIEFYEEFVGGVVTNTQILAQNRWTCSVSGTGTAVHVQSSGIAEWGEVEIETGTLATGRAGCGTNVLGIRISGGEYFRVKMEAVDIGDSNDFYYAFYGFCDSTTTGVCTDGIGFEINTSNLDPLSANVRGVTYEAGSKSVTTADTILAGEHIFEFFVNDDASSVSYIVDNNGIGAITTNIPDSGDQSGIVFKLLKEGGTTEQRHRLHAIKTGVLKSDGADFRDV